MALRKRLDQRLVEEGLVESLNRARSLIMAGKVLVADRPVSKSGTPVDLRATIRLTVKTTPWVSRGGEKLARALDIWDLNPRGKVCLDVGASTGGFTDVLLSRGARKVYAVDVGYGQLAWKLVCNPRVVVLDRSNIRKMPREKIPEPVAFLTIDVSFIALRQALPHALSFLQSGGSGVALLKPQFELSKAKIAAGGVVRNPAYHDEAQAIMGQWADTHGVKIVATAPSPIVGPGGNREFLIYFSLPPDYHGNIKNQGSIWIPGCC